MTQEEKAKRYDEAIEIARQIHDADRVSGIELTTCEEIFPELVESEDEKVRKELIQYLEECTNLPNGKYCRADFFDWLEKQANHANFLNNIQIGDKVTRNEDGVLVNLSQLKRVAKLSEKQGEQGDSDIKDYNSIDPHFGKPVNKVEPKFHEGDWIVYNRNDYSREIMQIYDIRDDRYYFTDNVRFSWSIKECDEKCHLWTIEDAKDGDVLAYESGWTCVFKALNNHTNTFSSYCFMDEGKYFYNTGGECHTLNEAFIKVFGGEIHPATIEQRNTLMKAMADAGYTFDFEKKELKKIEQKSAWSEEDDKMLDSIIEEVRYIGDFPDYPTKEENELYDECLAKVDWLKSLKDRVQPKQEWSEEDKNHVKSILSTIEYCKAQFPNAQAVVEAYNADIEWLNYLRPQNRWKPSDEQMDNK